MLIGKIKRGSWNVGSLEEEQLLLCGGLAWLQKSVQYPVSRFRRAVRKERNRRQWLRRETALETRLRERSTHLTRADEVRAEEVCGGWESVAQEDVQTLEQALGQLALVDVIVNIRSINSPTTE